MNLATKLGEFVRANVGIHIPAPVCSHMGNAVELSPETMDPILVGFHLLPPKEEEHL